MSFTISLADALHFQYLQCGTRMLHVANKSADRERSLIEAYPAHTAPDKSHLLKIWLSKSALESRYAIASVYHIFYFLSCFMSNIIHSCHFHLCSYSTAYCCVCLFLICNVTFIGHFCNCHLTCNRPIIDDHNRLFFILSLTSLRVLYCINCIIEAL